MEVSKGIESKMLRAKMFSEFKKQNLVEEDLQEEDDKETRRFTACQGQEEGCPEEEARREAVKQEAR